MMLRLLGRVLLGPEIDPATRAKLGLLPDHAGGGPLHVGNFRTAQAERIAHAGLLLFGGISPPGCRHGPRRGSQDHPTEQFSSKSKVTHDSPDPSKDKL